MSVRTCWAPVFLVVVALTPTLAAQPLFIGPGFFPPSLTASEGLLGNVIFSPINAGATGVQTCQNLCFYLNDVVCGGSGTITINALPSAPFTFKNYRVGTTCANAEPVTPPVPISEGEAFYYDVEFTPTAPGRYVDSAIITKQLLNLFGSATSTFACIPSATTACLEAGRFKVTATFRSSAGSGAANLVTLTPDTAYLWFTDPTNVEATIKVIDGCVLNSHYWVFAAGLTNVRVVLTVTDSVTNKTVTYINPNNTAFEPIQDTSALAACP
jgi:hypothetical protein